MVLQGGSFSCLLPVVNTALSNLYSSLSDVESQPPVGPNM